MPQRSRASNAQKSVEKPAAGTRLSAAEIHDNVLGPAQEEMARSAASLLWSSLASGLTIGFSFLLGAYAQSLVSESYARFAAGLAYPVGFVFVIFARSELFTENTLEPVIPLLHERDARTLRSLLRLWGILLAGNLFGAAIFASLLYYSPVIAAGPVREALLSISSGSTSDGFALTLVRGIAAGWLIALLTWLLASTHDSVSHLLLIVITTAPISWLGFRHSIVGSVEALYRVSAGTAGLGQMVGTFIVPAVIGNAIGGVVLVAVLNYGQVQHERGREARGGMRDKP